MTSHQLDGRLNSKASAFRLTKVKQGLTSHQTHYRSYRGRVITCQMTQPTVLKHGSTRQNMFYSVLESGNHVIVIVTSDWSLLLFAFCSCRFYHSCVNYSKLYQLFKLLVVPLG